MVTRKNTASKETQRKKPSAKKGVSKVGKADPGMGKEPLSQDEVAMLLNAVDTPEDRTLLILGLTTGMRATEIVSLEPINFEFGSGTLKIWDKKKRRYRSVYLTDETINEIRALIDTRKDSAGPRLFPYNAKVVEAKFQKHTLRALGNSRTWEAARRTYISTSAKLDIPIKIVVENTGELASTIVKYYMDSILLNPRRKVNEVQLYPESPRLLLKNDDLKRTLEGPYVEIINRVMSDANLGRSGINGVKDHSGRIIYP